MRGERYEVLTHGETGHSVPACGAQKPKSCTTVVYAEIHGHITGVENNGRGIAASTNVVSVRSDNRSSASAELDRLCAGSRINKRGSGSRHDRIPRSTRDHSSPATQSETVSFPWVDLR